MNEKELIEYKEFNIMVNSDPILQVNAEKLPSLEGQLSFLDRMAEEEPPAFSFNQKAEKLARLGELNALLDIDKNDDPILDSGQEELDTLPGDRENGERQR